MVVAGGNVPSPYEVAPAGAAVISAKPDAWLEERSTETEVTYKALLLFHERFTFPEFAPGEADAANDIGTIFAEHVVAESVYPVGHEYATAAVVMTSLHVEPLRLYPKLHE